MLCLKIDMQRVQKVHWIKTLQWVYNNYMATYDDLLPLDNRLKTQRHFHFLASEIYKPKNKINP